jgi:hypothetical protein
MKRPIRVGDLVTYDTWGRVSNLGVYLGDVAFDRFDIHHKFYSVTYGLVRTTLVDLRLLSRLPLPREDL